MTAVKGKLIFVDLNKGKIEVEKYDENLAKLYLGGSGLASYFFTTRFDNRVDPLNEKNPLMVIAGLVTGTPIPTACKTSICARSPLTNIWGESTVGGFWGPELKFAGFDGIIFSGKSKTPVYLWIEDEKVELKNADFLWGKNTFEVDRLLKEKLGDKVHVLCIGQSGEKGSKLASIMAEGLDARAAARTGLGAVMGSKHLKAVVVKATKKSLELVRRKELISSIKEANPSVVKFRQGSRDFGTNGSLMGSEAMGDLPIKNWTLGSWKEGSEKICGQAVAKTIFAQHYACFACPIRCGKEVKLNNGPYAGMIGKGAEYETAAAFGSLLLLESVEAIAEANFLCNDYGIDTLGVGHVVAFAIEAFERGFLKKEQTGGLELKWGDSETILRLVEKICKREGIGAVLADGTRKAVEVYGDKTSEFAIHVKGMEPACHDPRAFQALGLNYATSNRGACHLEAMAHSVEWGTPNYDYGYDEHVDRFSWEGKGRLVALQQNYMAVLNALGICKFLFLGRVGPKQVAQWVNDALGWDLNLEKITEIGDRIYNVKRAFNVRLGISRKDDTLPTRLLCLDRKEGSAAGHLPYLNKMLGEYYQERGWDEFGIPIPETLDRLGLKHMKAYLHPWY